jgi:hypothetical protein
MVREIKVKHCADDELHAVVESSTNSASRCICQQWSLCLQLFFNPYFISNLHIYI